MKTTITKTLKREKEKEKHDDDSEDNDAKDDGNMIKGVRRK